MADSIRASPTAALPSSKSPGAQETCGKAHNATDRCKIPARMIAEGTCPDCAAPVPAIRLDIANIHAELNVSNRQQLLNKLMASAGNQEKA
jgi:hypothetical protein